MSIQAYLRQSTGDFPLPNVQGVAGSWMDLCTLTLQHGRLWAGDPWLANDDDGVVFNVKSGMYIVQVMGMDFEGHRRIARVRIFDQTAWDFESQPTQVTVKDEMGFLGICDLTAMNHAVEPDHYEDFTEDLDKVIDEDAVECIDFAYAGRHFEMVMLPAGLGDGEYDVFQLMAHGKVVGMEIEFLPYDFMVRSQ
ncbi:MAG TPA: hypothetical protein DCM28_07620 [Phycisphaerales bacterium]|nr:hypothetical protein [Phycisphaerales bacterium]HCD33213.1 hypothetical protein [Phycisphaerales bacterium]|tara:strand:+ start:2793 stop:3374 length:582 start_codon:yes stop_codon:yes gene_type:complete